MVHACAVAGCHETGEFRAPPLDDGTGPADRPPQWRWLCLDHVRAFNAGYNFFSGMSADEIEAAQRPYAGWERETRAFSTNATSPAPKWQDFADPLDAISARFKERMREAAQRADGRILSPDDRKALKVLHLGVDADRKMLRSRYTELARRYHPDHNGGDRGHEKALQDVIAAYTHLRKAPAFA
ncbi:MAG: DnaJ domain-containing protein [Sphingobium sp.]